MIVSVPLSGLPGRRRHPVSGHGDSEIAALVDLHGRLTGMPRPADDAAKRELLNRRLRQAFYQRAEAEAAGRGRPLDGAELRRVLVRYPGDL
jgi:hypothetical protein